MKRFTVLTLLIIVVLLTTCEPVYAGWLSNSKDWILENALASILGMIFMVVSAFFGGSIVGKILLRSKLPIYEAKDVLLAVHNARKADSPAGKSITPEERNVIWKEVEEVIGAVIVAAGGKTSN